MFATNFNTTFSEIICRHAKSSPRIHRCTTELYHLVGIFGSVGHRVKIHKITPVTGKERGDLEIKDYNL